MIEALTKGHKIEAIKILRQERELGLKEAKDAVDRYVEARPDLVSQFQAASAGNNRLTLLLLVILLAVFLYYKFLHR